MSSITIIWSMIAGACVMLAYIHLSIWGGDRAHLPHGWFAGLALSVAGLAISELGMMHADTTGAYATAQRWLHVPAFFGIVSIIVFVHTFLGAGRRWLGYTVIALRAVSLIADFSTGVNLNYLEITALQQVELWGGETAAVASGVFNAWTRVGQLSLLLLLVYVMDASIIAWKRGDRNSQRQAVIIGGAMVVFVFGATTHYALVLEKIIQLPHMVAPMFLAMILAMGYELSANVVRSVRLAVELNKSESALRVSERRLELAVDASGIGTWEWDIGRDEIWLSDQAREKVGFSPSERVDFKRFLQTLYPADREGVQTAIANSLKNGGRFVREYRIVLPDRNVRWISSRGQVEVTAGGTATAMRGTLADITERTALEARFRQVVENAPIGMLLINGDGKIELVNARIEADFGYSRDELAGQSVEMLVHERYRDRHVAERGKFIAAPVARRMTMREIAGKHKDGSEVPVEIGLDPLYALGDAGVVILATVVNVAERKRHEETLRKERAFLRQVIDITPNLIFAKNREGRFTLVNQAVADLYGKHPSELIGKTDADFNQNAEEVERFRSADLEVMDTLREKYIREEKITDAAGAVRWLQTVKRPILDRDGTANHTLGSSADITARRQVEQELREREVQLNGILGATGDGILAVDRDGKVIQANRRFMQMWRIPQALIDSKDDRALLEYVMEQVSDPDAFVRKVRELYDSDAEFTDELEFKDGRTFERYTSSLILSGRNVGRLWSFRDITQRIHAERDLNNKRNELAHLSRVTMLGELSGSLAHELNQPLTAILSNAQAALRFLSRDPGNINEVRSILEDIVEDDKRAGEVIRRLRALLRKDDPNHQPLDVNELVHEVMRLMRSDLVNRDVAVKVDLAAGLPRVNGDRIQLQQVLLNLIMNGCDAMGDAGNVHSRLELYTRRTADGSVEFAVIDEGQGIPADDLEHIFEPFVTTKARGMGLGLAVCKTIIKSHGGRLWAANNVEKGAAFRFVLPALNEDAP